MPRFSANLVYYSLNLAHIKNQKIIDQHLTPVNDINGAAYMPNGFNNYMFQPWNYSKDFDHIVKNNLTNQMITSYTASNDLYTPDLSPCPTNCDYCNTNECLFCTSGYYLNAGVCQTLTINNYYFLSPAFVKTVPATLETPADITFNPVASITTSFTVSFFVKVLGWNTTNASYDIFKYGNGLALRYVIGTGNLEIYAIGSGTTLGTFANFKPLFGSWINISMSYFYDGTVVAYYPSMLNLQVNFTPVIVTQGSTIDNLNINNMVISKDSIALYANIWVWNKYMTGNWAFESMTTPSIAPQAKFIDAPLTNTGCINNSDLVTAIDYTCVLEYNNLLDKTNYCATPSFVDNTATCLAVNASCPYGYYTTSPTDSCSCEMAVTDMWVNSNNTSDGLHSCQKLDYVDFARLSPTTVSTASTSTTGYTMEFWVYINTYVAGTFNGFDIQWDKQLWINLSYNNGYISSCYPLYDSTNTQYELSNKESINLTDPTKWVYIRCSVDTTNKLYFHFHETMVTSEKTLSGNAPTITAGQQTTLKFISNSTDRGVIFFRQFRLWNCYLCQQADTYKLDITSASVASYTNLLHLWDPVYGATITDMKNAGANIITPTINPVSLGYNLLNIPNTYYKLVSPTYLCLETVVVCTGLLKFNQISDISFTNIPPAMNSRYTIEFWTLVTNVQQVKTGYHLIWKNIISVSIVQDTTSTGLDIYCFPQDYKLNVANTTGSAIHTLASNTANVDSIKTSNYNGKWQWVRCAVSNNQKEFYLSNNAIKQLKSDLMYTYNQNGVSKSVLNDVPFRYFFKDSELSTFSLLGSNKNSSSDIYIRYVYLFNDYIPQSYAFKY